MKCTVNEGCSITSTRGILGPGETTTERDLPNESAKRLVEAGVLTEVATAKVTKPAPVKTDG